MKPVLHTARLHFDQEQLDLTPDKFNSCEKLYVDFTIAHREGATQLTAAVHPKTAITLKGLEIRFSMDYPSAAQVWCSGLHPKRHASEINITDKPTPKGWLTTAPSPPFADPKMPISLPLYAWSYGYVKSGDDYLLIGSTNEETAYTYIGYDHTNQQLVIQKDIENLQLSHSFPLLELTLLRGSRESVFKHYFSDAAPRPAPAFSGWMSHKENGTHSATAIRQFLKIQKEKNIPADLLLIGPGYEKAMGDWLHSNDNFPDGLPTLIQEIKGAGLKVGMAISPLLVAVDSDIYKTHQDWLVKDQQQQLATYTSEKEKYYVLDVYHAGVQDYLQVFCYRIINQWGVDLLRVDHLSAAYVVARPTKTRAQVTTDIMRVLRGSCPDILLWATGLPLATGWSMADYTATTVNRFDRFRDRFPKFYYDPTGASAGAQLVSALGRYHGGDKVGFAATELSADGVLTALQQHTVLVLTALLGRVNLLTARPEKLSDEAWAEWRMADGLKGAKVTDIRVFSAGCFQVDFRNGATDFAGYFNLGSAKVEVRGVLLGIGEGVVLGSKNA